MLELNTPSEIVEKMVLHIENERKLQKLQQKELALKADIPLPTYKDFIYKKRISFENLIKLLIALRLFQNIKGLLHEREIRTLDEIRNEKQLPKRVVK
jgi:predicted transcriptional regulator